MILLKDLFAPQRAKSQAQIAARAAMVITRVIFDVGIDSLVNGSLLLDKKFRLRFVGATPPAGAPIIAFVPVGELAEAQVFLSLDKAAGQASTLDPQIHSLAHGVMREFKAQSQAVRALP